MDDRVGEILAKRAALDAGAVPAVVIAILLHGGLTAIAVYAAMHAPAIATSAPVITMTFAHPNPVGGQAPSPVLTQAQARAPVPPLEKPRPKITAPQPRAEDVKPTTAKPVPNTVGMSPFGRSTKKGSENPEVKAATPVQTSEPVGVAGIEGGDFPYTIYIERMKTLIGQHWLRPQIAGSLSTTVHFVIDRDGTVRDVTIETPSATPAFDRAAQRAILESSPLPPLPFGYAGTYLGVHLKFQ
jgi:TonB family protein